jgi:hypothetical protein
MSPFNSEGARCSMVSSTAGPAVTIISTTRGGSSCLTSSSGDFAAEKFPSPAN